MLCICIFMLKDEMTMRPIIHIVEWLPVIDYLNEEREAPALSAALRLHNVLYTLHSTFSRSAFLGAFDDIEAWHDGMDNIEIVGDVDDEGDEVEEEVEDDEDSMPIIHVSAHGDATGISVDDRKEEVKWNVLGKRLSDLSDNIGGVVLAMASCKGFYAYKAAGKAILPFTHVVGSRGTPSPQQILPAFSTLYYQLQSGAEWDHAVEAMRIASGHSDFIGLSCEEAESLYELRKLRITRVRRRG